MPHKQVTPVMLECLPGELCSRPYPGHKPGCPNYGARSSCPPQAALWSSAYFSGLGTWPLEIKLNGWPDAIAGHFTGLKVWAIWNVYNFGAHCDRMRAKHPDWSDRKVECCRYWQPTARKQLGEAIKTFDEDVFWRRGLHPVVTRIPEAHGVNVTATMQTIGITSNGLRVL